VNDNEAIHYAVTVERYYYALQGRFVALTAADWVTIEGWHRLRIPIECVLKGMDHAFSRQHVDIHSLQFCDLSVKAVCRETCSVLTEVTLLEDPRRE
jgi:hypothetical protein